MLNLPSISSWVFVSFYTQCGFPGGAKWESTCLPVKVDIRDVGSIPGSGRSPGGGHGNPLQDSCLENPRDGGAWWAAIYGVAHSRTRLKRLSSSSPARESFISSTSRRHVGKCWSLSPVPLFKPPGTVACQAPLVHGESPGKNTGVGCRALLQGIFPTYGSNLCLLLLLRWQACSFPLAPPGECIALKHFGPAEVRLS